ncbi:MAG: hypothetical protein K6F80_00970 [Oscillospiraceae bacterium]|nr:hypothetical protein [Oscillospiraceae bacterium]
MRILNRSGAGCQMCSRLPVPSDEDMQWMRSGQPLSSLIAEAFDEQKRKAREAAEAAEAAVQDAEAAEETPKDAMESMNSTLDDLEKLFGFGDAAEPEPEAEPEPIPEEAFDPLIAEDTKTEPLMYHYKDSDFLITAHKDIAVQFCPFCGSKLALTGTEE